MKEKRRLFTPSIIQSLLENADSPLLNGKLDATMATKFFLMVLLDRLLVPGTSKFISAEVRYAVHDLENLKDVNWCKLVFNGMKEGIKDCQIRKTNNIKGCIDVPMVSIFTNLFSFWVENHLTESCSTGFLFGPHKEARWHCSESLPLPKNSSICFPRID